MTRIFISYSRVDKNITKNLAELLSHAYDHVWYDTAKLVGGDEWWSKILDEIASCDHFIYLLSPESIDSEWCQEELSEAQRQQKHIIPVRIRDRTFIPDNLRPLQCIEMFDKVTVRGLNQIYAALIRQAHIPFSSQYGEKYRIADLKILQKLWPLVNSKYLHQLERDLILYALMEDSQVNIQD